MSSDHLAFSWHKATWSQTRGADIRRTRGRLLGQHSSRSFPKEKQCCHECLFFALIFAVADQTARGLDAHFNGRILARLLLNRRTSGQRGDY